MCGIHGYFGNEQNIKNFFLLSLDKLSHRGPDFQKYISYNVFNKVLYLGHARLSIIDLKKRSNQPFFFNNSYLIFNGEIYNYKLLRSELKKLGHSFFTSSDTEVLIHSIHQWGLKKALSKFEGMWAFCYADLNKKKLYLARDRFGEKPLYYIYNNKNLYFSSEVFSLKEFYSKKIKINFEHLSNYLTYGYRSLHKVNNTFFSEIKEVEKSTYLEIGLDSQISKENYWDPKNIIEKNKNIKYSTYEEILHDVKKSLINSVKLRMNSDVPVAFCLSSGIDSNLLTMIAKKILKKNITAFTVLSEDKKYDEFSLTKKSAEHLGIELIKVKPIKKNFLEMIKSLVKTRSYPLYTITSFVHLHLLKKISSKKFKVAISGLGADELFSGYYEHYNEFLHSIICNKKKYNFYLNFWKKNYYPFIRNKNLKNHKLFSILSYHNYQKKNVAFCSNMLIKNSNNINYITDRSFQKDYLKNRMFNELFYETVPPMLHEEDLNAMYSSVENRSPYLDTNLFEITSRIPSHFLFNEGLMKSILRDCMKKYLLPEIINRKIKMGFNSSIFDYISLDYQTKKTLLQKDSPIFEIINYKKFSKFLDTVENSNEHSKFLFNFINTKYFLEEFY